MGGAINVWMLHVGRFLNGVAGGMTAASIPVGNHGYIDLKKLFTNYFIISLANLDKD